MRLKNIVLTNLIHDRLVYYERLEREMNSTNDVEIQSKKIRKFLKKISNLDNMIKLWESIIERSDADINKIKEEFKKIEKNG